MERSFWTVKLAAPDLLVLGLAEGQVLAFARESFSSVTGAVTTDSVTRDGSCSMIQQHLFFSVLL